MSWIVFETSKESKVVHMKMEKEIFKFIISILFLLFINFSFCDWSNLRKIDFMFVTININIFKHKINSVIPWKKDVQEGEILKGEYDVKIYDLELVGNCPIDYSGDMNGIFPLGITYSGITVGERYHEAIYNIDMKNITVSQFRNGLMFERIVGNGLVQNVHAYNCFANGIEVASSNFTLENIKFGKCGAAGIELSPAYSNKSGVNFDQNQTITFKGELDVSENYTNGATKYFIWT